MLIEQQPATPLNGGTAGTAEVSEPQQVLQAETDTAPEATAESETINGRQTNSQPVQEPPVAARQVAAPVAQEQSDDEDNMTMAELLDNPANALRTLQRGEVIDGIVARIDPDEVLVDIGLKSEGVISGREMDDEISGKLQIGSKVLVYVMQPEGPEGHAILSIRRARMEKSWRKAEELH